MVQQQGVQMASAEQPNGDGVYSPLRHPSTASNAPPQPLSLEKSSSSDSNKPFALPKQNGYSMQHHLQQWWDCMLQKLEDKQPECPYEFMQEQLDAKLRERKLSELDENATRSLIEALAAVSDQGDRLSRFDALLVALNMVSDNPSVDPLTGDTRAKLEHMLSDFDMKPNEEIDDKEVLRFLKDAMAARAISREGYRQPHLMLNFDVNQTILMVDSITGTKEAEVVNDVLSNHGWGKIFPEEASDDNNNVGAWKLAYNEPYVECPEPGLICYADYVNKVNVMPTDKSNREELNAVRKKRRGLRNRFTDAGHPGEPLREHHRRMMDGLQLPAELKGTPEACSVGLEGHTVLLLPCFLQMLIELKKMRRSFTLLFRTYGLDLGKVQKELNAFCEGRHPLFQEMPRFDGSDGEPDYRMALDSVTQSGTWYREIEQVEGTEGKELFVLIMGTVAQPPEKPKKGDILGMPFFEHLKAERQKKIREQHAGDLDIGEIDDGIEILKGSDAVKRYCSFCEAKTVALRDFFPFWQQRGQKADGGKPLFINRSNLHRVLPIFFDDNCSKTDAKIVDVRSASRFLSNQHSRQRSSIDISEAYGLFVQQAEPLLSINCPMYYIDKIKVCEANHRELMRRRGQLGELVGRLLQVPKHELKVVVRQAAAASMFHCVRSARRRMSEDTSIIIRGLDVDEGPRFTGAVRVIAVTSGLACGGEQVVEILRQLGATVINCRKIRMETYFRGTRCHAEILQAMAQEGKNVLGKDQEIDHLIDQNPILHEKMNKIVWPHVKEAVHSKIQELDEETQMGIYYTEDPWMIRRVVVIHASDLVESGLLSCAQEIWTVTADVEARARALAARGMPPNLEEARAYIQNHIDLEFPTQDTDKRIVRIENPCDFEALREKVVAEWQTLHRRMYCKKEENQEGVLEVVSPEDELIGAAPVSEVWNLFLWHRMVFVVIRHQGSGGFYAAQRSLSKSYMPGRWDLAVFGRPQCAAVPAGGSASKVACEALKDKLGVAFPEESLVEITKFEYRGALTSNMYSGNGRVSFIGIVFEAFLDVPVENLVFNNAEVQKITILSPNECLAMQQEQLVPMTSCAYDAYSAYFFLAEERSKVPNIIATPGEPGPRPTEEEVKSWVLPQTDFSSGLFIMGLSGHDLSTRRDVSAIISELGATVIDCQRVARQCYQKGKACFKAIVAEFGNIVIGEDGEVNQRLLGPLLQARPEMLKSIQEIIRPHLHEALKQRILRIQEDHRDVVSMKEGAKQLVRRVIVLENAVLTESGLVYFCDEMWTVQNNWDDLTRRRVVSAPTGIRRNELKNTRVAVSYDSKCKTGIGVEIKVENQDLLRSDVVWQWQELHRRMYTTAKVLDGVNLENCPVVEVCDLNGRCVGVSPLPWVRSNCLVHRVAVTVLRNRSSGHFYVTRRSFHHQYLPGALDLAVIGNPGIMEVRCGESPEDASARALREILGIRAQVEPERIGEFPYQGIWRAWPTLEHACTMFGVLFEAFVDIPLEDFQLDKEHATEIMYVSGAEVMALPKDALAPITACYFNHYWATRMGSMSIRGRR